MAKRTPKVDVNELSFDRPPRGHGIWAFQVDTEVIYIANFYSKAKAEACRLAAGRGINQIKVLA